jgi:hypothetical protein
VVSCLATCPLPDGFFRRMSVEPAHFGCSVESGL